MHEGGNGAEVRGGSDGAVAYDGSRGLGEEEDDEEEGESGNYGQEPEDPGPACCVA